MRVHYSVRSIRALREVGKGTSKCPIITFMKSSCLMLQTILIHSAAGGVGFAAVEVAKSIGAEVLWTPSYGSDEKLTQSDLRDRW